nr:MAG TPA: protein of unknown function DUF859 [Caudoviricetes sp.]
MASCSFTHNGRTFKLEVVETSYSIENNTSNIQWTLSISGGGGSYYDSYAKATVNGNVVYNETKSWSSGSFPAKDGNVSGTISNIAHDSQGKKSISFALEGYSYVYNTQSTSGSLTLTDIPRYFTKTPTLEVVSKTETSITIKWTTSENASRSQYKIDNGSWVDVETNINKKTGTMTINGLTPNHTHTIYGDFMRKDSGLWCQTKPSINVTMYDYPYINSTPNFTIGDVLNIGIYNPLGRSCDIYVIGADDSEDSGNTSSDTSISGYNDTSYQNFFYDSIPNSNTGTYKVRLVCGEVNRDITATGGTYSTNTAECSPSFSSFDAKDNNSSIVAVTGNNQVFVKGKSTLYVMIPSANKMTTQKSATPSSYSLSCDTLNKSANYSTNDVNVSMGSISNSGTLRVNVRAYDSRSNSALAYKDITVYDYTKPTINLSAKRLNDFENQTTLSISGTYTRLTINNTDKNTITNVKYRYREAGGTWSGWTNVNTTVISGKFTCSDVILSLDNTKSFEFEIQATDKLDSNASTTSIDVGQAIFLISSNKKACYINGQEILMYDVVDTW